tara:strand:- start:1131 stop:1307 length:177 start_codon:yes stop_codon:yes gene_type:complete
MIKVYGVESGQGAVDVSKSLLGAKQYATRCNYSIVYLRYGYNVRKASVKVNGKWNDLL